jgi:hypothetical protein
MLTRGALQRVGVAALIVLALWLAVAWAMT